MNPVRDTDSLKRFHHSFSRFDIGFRGFETVQIHQNILEISLTRGKFAICKVLVFFTCYNKILLRNVIMQMAAMRRVAAVVV